jgi:hypothetical protein
MEWVGSNLRNGNVVEVVLVSWLGRSNQVSYVAWLRSKTHSPNTSSNKLPFCFKVSCMEDVPISLTATGR